MERVRKFVLFRYEKVAVLDIKSIDGKWSFAITNGGRLIKFETGTDYRDGELLKGSTNGDYRVYKLKQLMPDGSTKYVVLYFFKLVGEYFVEKPSSEHSKLIHKDHNLHEDHCNNLKWVTEAQWMEHYKSSPKVKRGRILTTAHNLRSDGRKLTSTQVMRIKKVYFAEGKETPKNRLSIIAKEFGVSVTHLLRIKNGENWNHLQV